MPFAFQADMSIAKQVLEILDTDEVLAQALRRRILSYQAAARWLISTYRLDTTIASVAAALRRAPQDSRTDFLADARAILHQAHINTRSELVAISVPNIPSVQQQLPGLLRRIEYGRGQTLRVISSDQGFKIIVDEVNLPWILDTVGKNVTEELNHGLTEISIVMPTEGAQTPGVLAIVHTALARRGINIIGTAAAVRQHILFVDHEDVRASYEALMQFVGTPQNSIHAPRASRSGSAASGRRKPGPGPRR